jgi:hypothetical protein
MSSDRLQLAQCQVTENFRVQALTQAVTHQVRLSIPLTWRLQMQSYRKKGPNAGCEIDKAKGFRTVAGTGRGCRASTSHA